MPAPPPVRHSLIVPAFNEEAYLPRLLDTVDRARAGYRGGPEAIEVIVADNVSTDGIRFERRSLGIDCTYAMFLLIGIAIRGVRHRCDLSVDTGVVFCRRRDFEEVGGYREEMLFAEDVRLLLDLRKLGRRRGQRVTRGTDAPSIFSTRKFDTWGDWHYFTMPVRVGWEILRGRGNTARRYWYDVRSEPRAP
jgi:glycosyltransferase involved in cell wall biosynthesis